MFIRAPLVLQVKGYSQSYFSLCSFFKSFYLPSPLSTLLASLNILHPLPPSQFLHSNAAVVKTGLQTTLKIVSFPDEFNGISLMVVLSSSPRTGATSQKIPNRIEFERSATTRVMDNAAKWKFTISNPPAWNPMESQEFTENVQLSIVTELGAEVVRAQDVTVVAQGVNAKRMDLHTRITIDWKSSGTTPHRTLHSDKHRYHIASPYTQSNAANVTHSINFFCRGCRTVPAGSRHFTYERNYKLPTRYKSSNKSLHHKPSARRARTIYKLTNSKYTTNS